MSIKKLFSDFKPSQQGLAKVLGHLEAEIMEIIWVKEKVSVREVYEELKLKREIAYTTVMTIMGRLAEKNILQKEARGNAYLYIPTMTREDFTAAMVREVIDGLMDDYADIASNYFAKKTNPQDEAKINELEKLLDKKRAEEEIG